MLAESQNATFNLAMFRHQLRHVLGSLISFTLISFASDADSAELAVTHLEPALVKELEINPSEGFGPSALVSTLSAKGGNAYLILRPTLVAKYESADAKTLTASLHSSEITITSPSGERIKPIGTYTLDGMFSSMLSSTLHLTGSDHTTEKPFYLSLVYPVNPAWKECVLNLGGSNYPVQVPAVVDRILRHSPANFEILRCGLETNSLESGSVPARSAAMRVLVTPLQGRLLSLEVEAQPNGPNVSQEGMDHREAFSLSSGDLGILLDGVAFHPCAGGEMDGKIYFGTTKHSYLKENRWPSLGGIYYFAIPVAAERFALLYKGLEVAHGVIRK